MNINSTRFGQVEVTQEELIEIPRGLIGFPDDTRFVLLRLRDDSPVAWLQSTTNASLAFPVVSMEALSPPYGGAALKSAAEAAGAKMSDDFAAMVVMAAANGCPATVNLLAPIVVDSNSRTGAQVLLEGQKLSAMEPLTKWLFKAPEPVIVAEKSEVQSEAVMPFPPHAPNARAEFAEAK